MLVFNGKSLVLEGNEKTAGDMVVMGSEGL